jgi:uncharacterized membrane protein
VSRYDWLLFLHLLSAFALVGGAVAIQSFQLATLRRERPSEIVLLMRLGKVSELVINVGAVGVLVFGIWLALDLDAYSITDGWIIASIVLWAVSGGLGARGGMRYKEARLEAERLAAAGDVATPELHAKLRDPIAAGLSWASGVLMLVILVLMVWKPGA